MDFSSWEPQYLQILDDFKFPREADERSAKYLSELLEKHTKDLELIDPEYLEKLLKDQPVFIFGEGLTLNDDLEAFDEEGTLITADGATSAALKHNIVPDIIVTDLDGRIEDQIEAVKKGAVILIHAHGDNQKQLERWVPKFAGKVMGTTQAEPFSNIQNFGGFTDGDRAVFLADHFKAKSINLIAFDFLEVGDHSEDSAVKLKMRKLTWANLLIAILDNPNIQFIPSNSRSQ
ncbi:MAG: DUF115 domain-containing protein [Thermoplasmata archaeon]|nr:MAG: DUF115 domain-containing protein [Thermoplasmata archaeon]